MKSERIEAGQHSAQRFSHSETVAAGQTSSPVIVGFASEAIRVAGHPALLAAFSSSTP